MKIKISTQGWGVGDPVIPWCGMGGYPKLQGPQDLLGFWGISDLKTAKGIPLPAGAGDLFAFAFKTIHA